MAIKGNFTIGGRSFAAKQASSGGNKKKKQTGTSFGPAGMVGSDQRLQNLIDRKDELKTQPGGQGDDRNLYQVKMNEFINRNPQNREAYASRFPIQNFMTQGLPNIARKIMPGAGVLSLLANIGDKIKGGLSRAGDFFDGRDDETFRKFSGGVRQGPPAYDASGLAGYRDAIMRNLEPTMSTKGFTPRQQLDAIRSFSVPGTGLFPVFDSYSVIPTTPEGAAQFNEIVEQSKTPPNIDVTLDVLDQQTIDPLQAAKDQQDKMMQMYGPREPQGPSGLAFGFPSQFQEGGLASINNPQYNMLMKASNFDV